MISHVHLHHHNCSKVSFGVSGSVSLSLRSGATVGVATVGGVGTVGAIVGATVGAVVGAIVVSTVGATVVARLVATVVATVGKGRREVLKVSSWANGS